MLIDTANSVRGGSVSVQVRCYVENNDVMILSADQDAVLLQLWEGNEHEPGERSANRVAVNIPISKWDDFRAMLLPADQLLRKPDEEPLGLVLRSRVSAKDGTLLVADALDRDENK
jgi:hypothetical protein